MGFGVAETHVVFEQVHAARRHHQAKEDDAGEVHAFGLDAAQSGFEDVVAESVHFGGTEAGMRRDDAHAAGVFAGIVFTDGFVVARADQRHDAAAVAEAE